VCDAFARAGVTFQPRLVVSAGYCGALDPALQVGDLVCPSQVLDSTGASWPCGGLDEPRDPAQPLPWYRGRLVSMTEVVAGPEEKRLLGRTHTAVAVDMESAGVARWCQERGLRFACLRAVSDTQTTQLPPQLLGAMRGERVAMVRLAAAVFARPGLAAQLWRLARDSRRASERLAAGICQGLARL
jgi:adenosylhomocysteine nucleosidase